MAYAKDKAEADSIKKENRDQEKKKKYLDALISGIRKYKGNETASEGNNQKAGNKGQLDGN